MSGFELVEAAAISCDVAEADWPFARDEAAAIEETWRRRTARTPQIWNGRVLLLKDGTFEAGAGRPVYRGRCFETDFKTFLGWREHGPSNDGVRNIFSMAALESADGAFLLGEMASHTASAGQVYFPSGTPDLSDVVGTKLDLEGSARRELQEETGLDPDTLAWEDGVTLILDPVRLCCMKRVVAPDPAEALAARIEGWLARDPLAELARVHVVHGPQDIVAAVPAFVVAYLNHRLSRSRT